MSLICHDLVVGQIAQVDPGWTIIMKTNGDTTFEYGSSHWGSITSVLDPNSDRTAAGNAKYPEYNTMEFSAIMFCVTSSDSCIQPYEFAEPISNAAALFGGSHRREGVVRADFERVFQPSGQQNCDPQRPGFNTQCNDGNRARWGYCNNLPNQACQVADTNDADAVIGIGLVGQDYCEY
eukprot:SAG22_NODE_3579_length_1633_cov_1.118644_2_plen_179_part_00